MPFGNGSSCCVTPTEKELVFKDCSLIPYYSNKVADIEKVLEFGTMKKIP